MQACVCFNCILESSMFLEVFPVAVCLCLCCRGGSQWELVAWGVLQTVRCWFLSALRHGLKASAHLLAVLLEWIRETWKCVCILTEILLGAKSHMETVDVDSCLLNNKLQELFVWMFAEVPLTAQTTWQIEWQKMVMFWITIQYHAVQNTFRMQYAIYYGVSLPSEVYLQTRDKTATSCIML